MHVIRPDSAGGPEVDLKIDMCRGDLQTVLGRGPGPGACSAVSDLVRGGSEGQNPQVTCLQTQVSSPYPCSLRASRPGFGPGVSDLNQFLGEADAISGQ